MTYSHFPNCKPKVEIVRFLSAAQQSQWLKLFSECFKCSPRKAAFVFKKYLINEPFFCLVWLNEKLVASYSGLALKCKQLGSIFMSCDTMSNGEIKGGSILAAEKLYKYLKKLNFKMVCGFPNSQIQGLRVEKLGWKIVDSVNVYFRIKFLPYIKQPGKHSLETFRLNRPSSGFFVPRLNLLELYGYSHPYALLELRMSNMDLGFPYFKIKKLRKTFGMKLLSADLEPNIDMWLQDLILTENSIDVP